ncbi:hypothetical protein [Nocardia colli]|uniref:hypothetical protein n=1 Tax=Nocardia colli TaxID=2545717 RepID=UPI0035D6CBFA
MGKWRNRIGVAVVTAAMSAVVPMTGVQIAGAQPSVAVQIADRSSDFSGPENEGPRAGGEQRGPIRTVARFVATNIRSGGAEVAVAGAKFVKDELTPGVVNVVDTSGRVLERIVPKFAVDGVVRPATLVIKSGGAVLSVLIEGGLKAGSEVAAVLAQKAGDLAEACLAKGLPAAILPGIIGALTGAIGGLAGGPVGVVTGAAAGGASGAVVGFAKACTKGITAELVGPSPRSAAPESGDPLSDATGFPDEALGGLLGARKLDQIPV